MDRQDGSIAPKLVVAAAKGDALEAEQRQGRRAHDAWLAGHVELAPACAHPR